MPDTVNDLVLDLLEWLGPTSRPYAEVMEAWRTSCPHLPVWEAANERGYIRRKFEAGSGAVVELSTVGMQYLYQHRAAGQV